MQHGKTMQHICESYHPLIFLLKRHVTMSHAALCIDRQMRTQMQGLIALRGHYKSCVRELSRKIPLPQVCYVPLLTKPRSLDHNN
jgi:hypothetical protein